MKSGKVSFDLVSTKDLRKILKQTLAEIRLEYGRNYPKYGRPIKDGANWYAANIETYLAGKAKSQAADGGE